MSNPESLIDRNPEARRFLDQSSSNLDSLRLFAWESFIEIAEGVFSTTNLDLQGERFDKQGLQALVDKVKSGPFFTGRNHDPLIHPIGRILTAEIFYDSVTNCWFTAGLTGFYDTQKIPTFESLGITETKSVALAPTAPEYTAAAAKIEFNPHEFSDSFVNDLLQDAPTFVTRGSDFHFRKSAEPLAILCFSVSLSAILNTPFFKKFQEKLGEEAGNQAITFLKWISKSVGKKLGSLKKDTRLVLQTSYKECELQFVVASQDAEVISLASEALSAASLEAMHLCDLLSQEEPQRIVFEFSLTAHDWLPSFAITGHSGVVVTQPHLLLAEHLHGGFSLGGKLSRNASESDVSS